MKTLTTALALCCATAVSAFAGVGPDPRNVQIRSIDFENEVIEVFNFDELDVDLSRWRFCSHDFNQQLRYSGFDGLDGVVLESGTSIFIHIANDAPSGDPDRFNRSDLGGSIATPLDRDAYGIQFYFPGSNGAVSFGNSDLIADHLQWNIDGSGVGFAERRTNQAVSVNLWSAVGDFIATQPDSTRVVLDDTTGGTDHGPSDYTVEGDVAVNSCAADFNNDGEVNLGDFGLFGSAFGSTTADMNYNELADFNADGAVDLGDFGLIGAEFGRSDCLD